MKIVKTKDTELIKEIDKKLEENKIKYGKKYCPCSFVHDDDHVCMCKEFVESIEEGPCHCGKYIKYKD